MITSVHLVRLITVSLFSAVLAGTWDVWWHGAMGRETFWSPPHLLLYISVIIAISGGCYVWWRTREPRWMRLAALLLLVPASAPFDELWHRFFGVEQINSPLIIWSPPHVFLALSIAGSFLYLFHVLANDRDPIARHLLQTIALASCLSLLLFLATPLEPTGPFHLFGFPGAAIGSGLFAMTLIFAQQRMQRFASASAVAGAVMLISAMNFGEQLSPATIIQPHDHPPGWLMIFSCLVPAAVIDLLVHSPLWFRGSIVGLLHAGILYGFSSRFFVPEFQYASQDMWFAIVTSLVAGLVAGLLVALVPPSHSSHSS